MNYGIHVLIKRIHVSIKRILVLINQCAHALQVLQDLVACVSDDMLIVQLLRCLQTFAQAACELGMASPHEAYLSAICDLTAHRPTAAPAAPMKAPVRTSSLEPLDGPASSPQLPQAPRKPKCAAQPRIYESS